MIKKFNEIEKNNFSGKYGFFMFLDIIDELKNSFISENYLNTENFNLFFTTDKINDKNKLTNLLEYKKSLNNGYNILIHIRNLRLSFYFGIKNFVLEYGFHDDLKRSIYKIGEFKIISNFFKSLNSYKSISLIINILKEITLKDLELLQNIKLDFKYLIEQNFSNIEIFDNRIIKVINNNELKKYNIKNINDYFDSWCLNYKWYYSVYNYIDIDELNTTFYLKIKETDSDLNFFKKNYDIRNILKENVDDDLKHIEQPLTDQPEIYEPMNREPLESPKLKISNKKRNTKVSKKGKDLLKYLKDLKKIIDKINNDLSKDKSYLTKYLYKVVYDYKKSFIDVKKDLKWLIYKLKTDPYFIDNLENKNENFKFDWEEEEIPPPNTDYDHLLDIKTTRNGRFILIKYNHRNDYPTDFYKYQLNRHKVLYNKSLYYIHIGYTEINKYTLNNCDFLCIDNEYKQFLWCDDDWDYFGIHVLDFLSNTTTMDKLLKTSGIT